jgi:hypothetical protein
VANTFFISFFQKFGGPAPFSPPPSFATGTCHYGRAASIAVNRVRGQLPSGNPLRGGGTYRILFVSRFWRKNSKIGRENWKSQKNLATMWRQHFFRQRSILSSACLEGSRLQAYGGIFCQLDKIKPVFGTDHCSLMTTRSNALVIKAYSDHMTWIACTPHLRIIAEIASFVPPTVFCHLKPPVPPMNEWMSEWLKLFIKVANRIRDPYDHFLQRSIPMTLDWNLRF